MVALPWRDRTPDDEIDLFMLTFADDTEDAPWMVMGDAQFWSASSLAHSLHIYKTANKLGWYVASMLPITYRWRGKGRLKTVAPDVFVAFADDHPRQSYNLENEGDFPPFVLEVVSPSSVVRDLEDKLELYNFLKAREYVLFRTDESTPQLLGYRRDATDNLVTWQPDAEGRLWSDALGLYLLIVEDRVQAMTRDGQLLLTPEQEAAARYAADAARRHAESENARLRAELERIRRQNPD